MVCPNCGTTNPRGARFCIACGQALPLVCPTCGTHNPSVARFCMQCGTPLTEDARAQVPVPNGAANGVVPPAPPRRTERAPARAPRRRTGSSRGDVAPAATPTTALAEAIPTEERRIVTIVFADLTSSTQLADSMDPEEVRALLTAYFNRMTFEIHRHGGTVEKYIGDAVMAVFGMPTTHEDDPVRAVRAALGMRAALRVFNDERRAADPLAGELRMRIGINTGEVAAAAGLTAAEGRDFLITGDAVNVAARLQQIGSPDSIIVGPRTYRSTRGAVVYRTLPPVEVQGKPRHIHVWEALAMADESDVPVPRPRGVEGIRAPLVGRDAEMDLLHAIYTRTLAERRPHLATVLGAPGVGKTRLVREFLNDVLGVSSVCGPDVPAESVVTQAAESAETPVVLEGRCPPYGESITYWPLAEMLRAHCGFSALDSPERARERLLHCVANTLAAAGRSDDAESIAAYLGHTIGIEDPDRSVALLPTDSQQLQEGRFRAWRAWFEALAAGRPLVVAVDDVHWADDALLDLLKYLATRVSGVPLLLVCAARPELLEKRTAWGRGQRNDISIALEPLSRHEAESLVRALLPSEHIPEALRRGILAKAEGNPFYVEEIVRMLADRGILVRAATRASESTADSAGAGREWCIASEWENSPEVVDPAIPDTVQGVLAARLDLLSPTERVLVQHAAIIGRYFWAGALQGLAPEMPRETIETLLEALQRKDLIVESARGGGVAPPGERAYSFKHTLTREVTYGTIPRTRRAHEHALLAEWLEGLAEGRSEGFVELLAYHYRQYYVQANLARSRSAARRQGVRRKVIFYLGRAGDSASARHAAAKAEDYYTDALALLDEEPSPENLSDRVMLLVKRADARTLQTDGDGAWRDYRDALRLWQDAGTTRHQKSAAETSAPLNMAAAGRLSPDWARLGMRLYRLLVQLPTRNLGWFREIPTHEELRTYLQAGLELAEGQGQQNTAEGAALLTAKSFFWWSWPEQRGETELMDALRSAREAVRVAEVLGDARGASEALDALGNMQATTGDLRGLLESQTRRLHWARQIEDTGELVDIQSEVSSAYELVGEYALAVEHARGALALAEDAEADLLRVQALQREVLVYYDWDHWTEALQIGDRLVAVGAQTPAKLSARHRSALLALATISTRMGQRDAAERYLKRVSVVPEPHEIQFVAVYRARLALARGAIKEAERVLLDALELRSGRVMIAALLAELAELGARSGDRTLSERFGEQALEAGWRSGARKALAQSIRARGIVAIADGRWDDAAADLHNALDRYRDLGTAWEQARTHYALAALARRGNVEDNAQAREELHAALRLFEALHAVRDIARVRAALSGAEVRLP